MIMEEERLEDCTAEELSDSLPTHQPRFAVFSFCHEHADGRVSYPMGESGDVFNEWNGAIS